MGYTTIISTPKPSINPNLLQYSHPGNVTLITGIFFSFSVRATEWEH